MSERYTNPVPQYFDDSGSPVISGKLYFYKTGTLTAKDTYADEDLAIANANPVVLDGSGRIPNIWLDGLYKVIFTDSDDTQEWARDPIGTTTLTQWATYSDPTTYSENDVVQGSDGEFYISLGDANQGNDPTSSPTEWDLLYLPTEDVDAHVNASAAVHGLTGAVAGVTDTQTFTNKTLTTPVLTNPTGTGFALWNNEQSEKSAVNITSTPTEIVALDMGTVLIGARILVVAKATGTKGGTAGVVIFVVEKKSGTAAVSAIAGERAAGVIGVNDDVAVSAVHSQNFTGVFEVTTGGTLVLQFTGDSNGSDFALSVLGAQCYAVVVQ